VTSAELLKALQWKHQQDDYWKHIEAQKDANSKYAKGYVFRMKQFYTLVIGKNVTNGASISIINTRWFQEIKRYTQKLHRGKQKKGGKSINN